MVQGGTRMAPPFLLMQTTGGLIECMIDSQGQTCCHGKEETESRTRASGQLWGEGLPFPKPSGPGQASRCCSTRLDVEVVRGLRPPSGRISKEHLWGARALLALQSLQGEGGGEGWQVLNQGPILIGHH